MGRERFDEQDTLLTLQEAAEFLRVSKATMHRLLASGQLTGHKVGRAWRFYKKDLHAFVKASSEQVPDSQPPKTRFQGTLQCLQANPAKGFAKP